MLRYSYYLYNAKTVGTFTYKNQFIFVQTFEFIVDGTSIKFPAT